MNKKKQTTNSTELSKIGCLLAQSLTMAQIERLLEVIFLKEDPGRYADDLRKSDPDAAATIDRVLNLISKKSDETPVRRIASDQKTFEYWKSLWSSWNELVFEVGEEDGKYAYQEVSWEPPYFAGEDLADDLDKIAAKMLGLINAVFDMEDDPELFIGAIDEIESNIMSYPDWMGESEACVLGENSTRCILKWTWLASREESSPGQAFLDRLCKLEDEFKLVELDDDICVDYFSELPDKICRDIYERISKDDWSGRLKNIHLKWYMIHHLYEGRFDHSEYLKTCRKYLSRDWQYGPPLIEDAMTRGNYGTADTLLKETFSVLLRGIEKNDWYPETSLLFDRASSYSSKEHEDFISKLLESWVIVSEELGNNSRSAALKLQNVIYHSEGDWDKVIREYKKLRTPEVAGSIDPLFIQWKDAMARKSTPSIMDRDISSDTWIHWLIEAELDIPGKKEWFLNKLKVWLKHMKEYEKDFKLQWSLLARLTKDLPGSSDLGKSHPNFFKVVLPGDSRSTLLGRSRCEGLKKMNAGSCLPAAMSVWESNLINIIPDPADAYKADYEEQARWMKALLDLSRKDYNRLLAQWHETHHRRRNLWRDMSRLNLPV